MSVLQRQEEARAALFSDWASAAYAWNKEEMAQGMKPPSLTFWTQVLVSLAVLLVRSFLCSWFPICLS